jgi:hypothetical protein
MDGSSPVIAIDVPSPVITMDGPSPSLQLMFLPLSLQ